MAWLAKCEPGNSTITVLYGNRIERRDTWFCEAVWAGEFEGGDFDRTDIVAGSGVRIRDCKVVFVSSGATVDRLNFIETREAIWVSNSLACVMAVTGAEVDATYPGYFQFFYSVVRGLKRYQRTLDTSAGPAHLIYFDNLEWDGGRMETVPKPRVEPHWQGFSDYHAFLRNTMGLVATNLRADGRLHSLRMLGTLSSGYDSTTVSVLAREAGCEEVISFDKAKGGRDDSGSAIAKAIGLRINIVPSEGWRSQKEPESLFIAADGFAEEVHFKAAEKYLDGTVLFTGYHGDRIWGKHPPDLSDQLSRGDPSGLALTEFRLHAGFIHCPVPFWGARDIGWVKRISNSVEMTPWDVPGGYSRPICRRIAEEAGIPRSVFGISKAAASRWPCTAREFLTSHSMEDYVQWLRERNLFRIMSMRLQPPICLAIDRWLLFSVELAERWVGRYLKLVGKTPGLNNRYLRRLATLNYCNTPQGPWILFLRRQLFVWAIDRTKERYRPGLCRQEQKP